MKTRKIMFYISSLAKAGAQRVLLNLAESLLEKGHEVFIVTTSVVEDEYPLPKGAVRIISDILEEEITSSRIKNIKKRIGKLRNIWKKEQPDVIVAFIGKNNFMALLTAWGLAIPVITSVRGDPKEEYYNRITRFLSKSLMGKSSGIILQTEDAKKYFPKWIQKKAVILGNPLNMDFVDDYYTGEREDKIVSVGRIDANKNQKLIIDAFYQIAEQFPETKLIIYGNGEEREKLLEYVKKNPYQDQIFLPGAVDDVKTHIQKAKLFVLSSNTEGLPNALMEALALGIPCVSTDCPCGGPKLLMEGKENGILVPVGDAEKMAKAMKQILENEEAWHKYSQNAYTIGNLLHPEKVNVEWENYLFSVIKNCNRRENGKY